MENQTNEITKENKSFDDSIKAIIKDRAIRHSVASQSHLMFFHIFLSHHVKFPIAEFQKDIFRITEDSTNKLACIVAFRGSAKSTLVTTSYSLWSILGVQQKKFVIIFCQTKSQAHQQMMNLRYELENNKLLKSDMGPFQEEKGGEWAASSIVFKNTNARIMVASIDQSIRGVKHNENRPDLIILDDIEDLGSTRTIESRNKTFDWFTREVLPLGNIGTRVILVGNLLHQDSLMMRLRRKIEAGEIDGIFKWFPLLDEKGRCLWPGKFATQEAIDILHRDTMDEFTWQQEYLLTIISDTTKVVYPEWIKKYKSLPKQSADGIIIGIDPAISLSESADYTAIVTIKVYFDNDGKPKFYVLSKPIKRRMSFPETIETIKILNNNYIIHNEKPINVIEANGFQEASAMMLENDGYNIVRKKNYSDKRTRLIATSPLIENGTIIFPEEGAEELISQLIGFGIEHHDDLADAFTMAVIFASENFKRFIPPQIFLV